MKEIPLTKGYVTLVDDADYEWLMQWKWYKGSRYAQRTIYLGGGRNNQRNKTIPLHQLIINVPEGCVPDHINGNTLDNQRANLRIATIAQNGANRKPHKRRVTNTQYKGIFWVKNLQKWKAACKGKYIGVFVSEIDAARAYDAAARQHFGEFARLNFSQE